MQTSGARVDALTRELAAFLDPGFSLPASEILEKPWATSGRCCPALIPGAGAKQFLPAPLTRYKPEPGFQGRHKTTALLIHQEKNGCCLFLWIIFSVKENTTVWQQLGLVVPRKGSREPSRCCFVYIVCVNTDFGAAPFILWARVPLHLTTRKCKVTGKYDTLFWGSWVCLLRVLTQQIPSFPQTVSAAQR